MNDLVRYINWIKLLRLLLITCIGGCTSSEKLDKITTAVKRGDLIFSSSFFGEIEARHSHAIFAPELRQTWQMTVESTLADGTLVKKGDVVLQFVKDTLEEDLREQQRELAVAQAGYRKVYEQHQDERITRTLVIKRDEMGVALAKLAVVEGVEFISKIDAEKAKVELARAQLQLDVHRKALKIFEKKAAAALAVEQLAVTTATEKVDDISAQLDSLTVRSPTDGVLYAPFTRLNWMKSRVSPGKVVRPGDKILEVPQLQEFNAVVYVRQRDATILQVGDEAEVVATMFPNQQLRGKIVGKDAFVTTRNERLGTTTPQGMLKEVRVIVEIDGETKDLRPGGTVRVDIHTVLAQDVVMVPLAAIREDGGKHVVVLANGKQVEVTLGKTSTTHAEICTGLTEDHVVVME